MHNAAAVATDTMVRNASMADVPQMFELLTHYASMGNLLPRPRSDIVRRILEFRVVAQADTILACGALEIFTEELGEVRSLVVSKGLQGKGYGKRLVKALVAEAHDLGLTRLMALTYKAEFFHKLGFEIVPRDSLPEKVWGVCVSCYKFNHCDETAVLLKL